MLKEMVVQKDKRSFRIPSMVVTAGLSMLIAHSEFIGMPSPLGCALAGALPFYLTPSIIAGSLVTYLISGRISDFAMVIFSLLIIAAGKWLVKDEDNSFVSSLIAAGGLGVSGILTAFVVDKSAFSLVIYMLFALLAGLTVYLLHNLAGAFGGESPLHLDKKTELSAAAVYILCITVLCSLDIAFLNAGRIIGIAAVMCAAKRFKYSGGVVLGVLTTAGIFINSPALGIPTAFLGIAGFGAGFASEYSKVSTASAFLAVNFCGQLITGLNDPSFYLQADAVLAAAVFMLIPDKYIMWGQIIRETETKGGELLLKARMEFVAGALVDIRKNMEGVISCLNKNNLPFNTVNEVSGRVCSKCRNKLSCWEADFENTNNCFLNLEKQGTINPESFPKGLIHCLKKEEIAENFLRCKKEEAIGKMLSAKVSESRTLLFSQIEATEGILSSLSDKMNFSYSKNLTRILCGFLDDSGIAYTTAIAYFNGNSRLIAEIYSDKKPEETIHELAHMLSYEFGVPMEASEPLSCGGETRLRFNRKTKYTVEVSCSQKSAYESQPSGDAFGFFEDGLGYAYLFISDGMGSGKQAALDSAIVSKLFKRLIKSGIDCECAVKMLNSIMLTKSEEESFATLDIARINLETCELVLFKSGASSTLIKYDDAVMMFNSPSTPIGILPDNRIFSRNCGFEAGNVLVMLSDGVDESLYQYIKEQLLEGDEPLEKITEDVCNSALRNAKDEIRDDITVLMLRAKERG